MFFQQVHLSDVKGWEHAQFVALFPAFTACAVVTTLIYGWAIDKWGSIRLLPFSLIPLVIGLYILATYDSLFAGLLGLLALAVMTGGFATVSVAFWSEAYGTKHVGSIKALSAALMVFGSAIGPIMTGQLIDIGYSFPEQMIAYAVYVIAVCGLTYYATQRFLRK